MEKMTAITFKETGHLLGVVTRAGQPDKAAAEVAAGGFRLRDSQTGDVTLLVPEDRIGVALVDYDTRILYRPQIFVLEGGQPEEKSDTAPALALDGTQVTVTLPANVSDSVEVWCQIVGGNLSEPVVMGVTVPGTSGVPTNTGSEPLTLGSGEYKVALFAPGYALSVFTVTV